jgi:hypothetical protein
LTDLYVKRKKLTLDPTQSKGKGGEAEVFGLGDFYSDKRQIVVKVYKTPDHPDYATNLHEQKGAAERLRVHQEKLPQFPKSLPPEMVAPIELATDKTGKLIGGYLMEFVSGHELLAQYSQISYRKSGVTIEQVTQILKTLYQALPKIHSQGLVLGDFNDLNVLATPAGSVRIIDADSAQFGPYKCTTFTSKFVDPLLCTQNPHDSGPILSKPHTKESDWYAFSVLLMQTLLCLDSGPYGGIYKPKDKTKRIKHSDRWKDRITVFHPEVVYPKPAIPLNVLPDDLLHSLEAIFVKDSRTPLDPKHLDLRWTTCNCGLVHARRNCPVCQKAQPGLVKQVTVVKGTVTVTNIFFTPGVILSSTVQHDKILFMYHSSNNYFREDGGYFLHGPLKPMRIKMSGDNTYLAQGNMVVSMGKSQAPIHVDKYRNLPVYDTNSRRMYWLENGKLYREDTLAPFYIGDVLREQTLFWVGEEFGFGFYRVGGMTIAFLFDAEKQGIDDSLKLTIKGTLIDSTCYFSKDRVWFFYTAKDGSKVYNHCVVYNRKGELLAQVSHEPQDEPWITSIRGKCAIGNQLFSATDEGLKRIEITTNGLEETKSYPDTEPFLDSSCSIYLVRSGLYVVSSHEVTLLKLS